MIAAGRLLVFKWNSACSLSAALQDLALPPFFGSGRSKQASRVWAEMASLEILVLFIFIFLKEPEIVREAWKSGWWGQIWSHISVGALLCSWSGGHATQSKSWDLQKRRVASNEAWINIISNAANLPADAPPQRSSFQSIYICSWKRRGERAMKTLFSHTASKSQMYIIDCLLQFELWFIKELCYRYSNSRTFIYSKITRGCFRECSDFRIRIRRFSFNFDFNLINLLYNIWSPSPKDWWIIVALKLAAQPERRLPASRGRQTGGGGTSVGPDRRPVWDLAVLLTVQHFEPRSRKLLLSVSVMWLWVRAALTETIKWLFHNLNSNPEKVTEKLYFKIHRFVEISNINRVNWQDLLVVPWYGYRKHPATNPWS